MIVAGSASPLLLSSAGGYNLTKSLRFRRSASANLSRTPASSGNQKIWTFSTWVKRGQLGVTQQILTARYPTVSWFVLGFTSNDVIEVAVTAGSAVGSLTNAVFRDPSAWYHIVLAFDTTQATAANRVKLYVNNVQQTFASTNYPAQNTDYQINQNVQHTIGGYSGEFFDGYQTEINLIDGQALTPSSFGQTSPTTGVWQPIKYTGTYGTNGFYLPFTNTTSTATLGNDFSGNNNTWTVNNISLTSGATYDSMNDVPTLTNATTANYCVLNPLSNGAGTLSNANLQLGGIGGAGLGRCNGTVAVSSGKWYFESTLTTASSYTNIGIGQGDITNQYPGQDAVSYAFTCEQAIKINNNNQPSYGVSLTTGDVLMVAFDLDNNKIFFGKNGTWMASSDPVTGANPAFTIAAGTYKPIARPYDSSGVINVNFGQRPFAYTPPTGFVALNTFNLPTPTIGATASSQANKYMDATLYTGNGSTQNIVNSGGFQPDFVWVKCRSAAKGHILNDALRGAGKLLSSDSTAAESGNTGDLIGSFNSNGFQVNQNYLGGSNDSSNQNGGTFVGWQWRASNTTAVTNTSGSITSTVSANTTAGFSIVTYTGNGANSTVGHGLGVAPSMIIVKARTGGGAFPRWHTYHASLGANAVMHLDTTSAVITPAPNYWNNTSPTSSVFSIGTDIYGPNVSPGTYVAYCFAQVAGYSAFGSYTGNGSSDGPFVYTGFRPRFFMIKRTDTTTNWIMYDTARMPYNTNPVGPIYANLSSAEESNTTLTAFDILSNGFKPRNTSSWAESNASGGTYIYMAFAESPFKYANAR